MTRLAPILSCALTLLVSSCDFAQFTADIQGDIYEIGGQAVEEHWDYEHVGRALPGSIMQIEGLIEISPENEILLVQGTRAYASYAFGWVEDDVERLTAAGDTEEAGVQRQRAIEMYQRGMRLGQHALALRDDEFQRMYEGELPAFKAWLRDEFDDPEDAPLLWWVGYAWGLYVNASHPTEAHRDRGYAIALVEQSVELDSSYYGSSGLGLLAFVATQRPNADLDQARGAWDRALESSGRRNLLILVTMARVYAVKAGDRELFTTLLREVVEAGDIEPSLRLSNKVARRRAFRYLGQAESLFAP